MGSNAYSVDLVELDGCIRHIAAFDAAVEHRLAELDARIAQIQSVWGGDAADMQLAAHLEWMRAAGEMRDGLARLKSAALVAHRNYAKAHQANAVMWAAVTPNGTGSGRS